MQLGASSRLIEKMRKPDAIEDLIRSRGNTIFGAMSMRREWDRPATRKARLMPLMIPIAGFLPAAWKLVLHERHGMDARRVTRMSVMLECLIIVLCGAVAALFIFARLPYMHHLILAAVIGADAAMRSSRLHEGRIELPGFYEWILPKIWRR